MYFDGSLLRVGDKTNLNSANIPLCLSSYKPTMILDISWTNALQYLYEHQGEAVLCRRLLLLGVASEGWVQPSA
jgi:hypothetical protein